MLLVGSSALWSQGYDIGRSPVDQDCIGDWSELQTLIKGFESSGTLKESYPLSDKKWVIKLVNGLIVEYEIAWAFSTGDNLIDIMSSGDVSILDMCYTLKMSHKYLKDSPHFYKTMSDIKLMEYLGAKIPVELEGWLSVREKETYDYSLPKLNTDKKDFFNTEGVEYTFDHDSLHEAVKVANVPAYTLFQPKGEQVWCDEGMFNSLTREQKLNAVFEESCVLALERCLIPFESWDNEEWAFKKALQKVCTSITSGWFREYAWDNHKDVLDMFYNGGYGLLYTFFHRGVAQGMVKRLKGS